MMEPPDSRQLPADAGQLELVNHSEANEVLDISTPALRTHPEVLEVRYAVYVAGKKWAEALEAASALVEQAPNRATSWLHRAYALHRLGRTREARNALLAVADSFPRDWLLRYNLAQYSCQLGEAKAAWDWLQQAFALGGSAQIKATALNDPDLEPLWDDLEKN